MNKDSPRDVVGDWYRKWIAALSHERLLPTPRVTFVVFLVAYAITFVWRALATSAWPFLFGLFVTILLTVRVTNLLIVRFLRRDLRRNTLDRRMDAGLRPIVTGTTMLVLFILGGAFVLAYTWLPGSPF